jgi:hypothetical protein
MGFPNAPYKTPAIQVPLASAQVRVEHNVRPAAQQLLLHQASQKTILTPSGTESAPAATQSEPQERTTAITC